MTNEERIKIEKQIATKIVDDALSRGLYISVNNGGEENEICLASDKEAILDNMFATDEDRLLFYIKREGDVRMFRKIGWVHLIYGNGYDVISDCLESIEMIPVLKGAADLADTLEKAQ